MPKEKTRRNLNAWDLTPKQAVLVQQELRSKTVTKDDFATIKTVAGVDVGFENNGKTTRAAIVVLDLATLQPIESQLIKTKTCFPYVPGLLSFRELPAILKAVEKLKVFPDLFLCDGQGIAHPRRMGIACHLGLCLDTPSIGVGKTRLIGRFDKVPEKKGEWVPLMDADECIGAVLCTRDHVKPIFVSVGHRISLAKAIEFVMACVTRYKLPETTRYAHALASRKNS